MTAYKSRFPGDHYVTLKENNQVRNEGRKIYRNTIINYPYLLVHKEADFHLPGYSEFPDDLLRKIRR